MARQLIAFHLAMEDEDVVGLSIRFEGDDEDTLFEFDSAVGRCPAFDAEAGNGGITVMAPESIDVPEDDRGWWETYVLPQLKVIVASTEPEEAPEESDLEPVAPELEVAEENHGGLGEGGEMPELDEEDSGTELGDADDDGTKGTKKEKVEVPKTRDGAGCKQPTEVEGWADGRVLSVVKSHRGKLAHFGRVEYRVQCHSDGSFELIHLSGNRNDVKVGQKWQYASLMFRDLMCVPPGTHHRMTIKRWFKLGGK